MEESKAETLNRNVYNRNTGIDCLKAIAIICVVLYHMGIFKVGYLGVDCFLVIAGYLTAKSIMKALDESRFSYFRFLIGRILRLVPITLFATAVCFVIGYFIMLPDDFENLCETIVATNVFCNNILQCITTRNYWDIVNEYKPLMHTWYLGILMQIYLVLPWVFMFARKVSAVKYKKIAFICSFILLIVSFVMYVLPFFSDASKFYFLPFRLFEVMIGVVTACAIEMNLNFIQTSISQKVIIFSICIGILTFFIINELSLGIILTCIFSAIAIQYIVKYLDNILQWGGVKLLIPFSYIGRRTLSIYIWHQILLAFTRYCFKTDFCFYDNLFYMIAVFVVSELSYYGLENRNFKNKTRHVKHTFKLAGIGCMFILINTAALIFYMRAGIVRDVPELDIYRNQYYRGMHADYNDRIRIYNKEFSENDKIHVLIIGNSFARDWGNILMESDMADQIEISYIEGMGETLDDKQLTMCDRADRIFWAVSDFRDLPESLVIYYEENKLFIVGCKSFGDSNGVAYNQRKDEHYYDFHVMLQSEYMLANERQKDKYGEQYVDMLEPVKNKDGTIFVYTPNHKFISQDCRHLTRNGAIFYADNLNLRMLLEGE